MNIFNSIKENNFMGLVAVKCPQCGADIQLDDSREFGFCNYCGTKIMQDKIVVEHTGSVKVDNTESLKNYLSMAENAIKASNGKEAQEYVNKVLEINPESSYAWLLKMKTVALTATVGDSKFTETVSYANNAIKYASEDEKEEITHEVYLNYLDRAITILLISLSKLKDTAQIKSLAGISVNGVAQGDEATRTLYLGNTNQALLFKTMIPVEYIESHEDMHEKVAQLAELYGSVCEADVKRLEIYGSKLTDEAINSRQKKLDLFMKGLPESTVNNISYDKVSTNSKSGCYVATAVYGSYDCPEVWTLRRYRDYSLALTWYGRLFITLYYAISPTIVKWFGHTQWFNKMWKGKLDRMVKKLQSLGYEDTPYNDKYREKYRE